MNWPAYAEYKESGVEWVDRIPVSWEIQKLRRVSSLTTGWTPPSGDDASYDGDNAWANISDLGPRVLESPVRSISDGAVRKSRIPVSPRGSLLFSFKLSVGQVSFAGADMYTNEAIATFRESERLDLGFAYYSFPYSLVKNANENIYGAKLLNQELMYAAKIPLPPVEEQRTIARFLDQETAKIDELITKQEQLIATLCEDRAATITQAVTKGLNPGAEMKDSGVEWVGGVPKSWTLGRIKQGFSVVLGKMYQGSPESPADTLRPHLKAGSLTSGLEIDTTNPMECWFSPEELSKLSIRDGDLLVVEGGATYGRCAIVREGLPGWGFQKSLNRIRPLRDDDIRFVSYLIQTATNCGHVSVLCGKATIPHFTAEKLANLEWPHPGPEEQKSIAHYLDERCAKIDRLIAKSTEMIGTLQEYRSALIADVITGKIDVRGVA